MKLTREDIKKYATEEEKKYLKEDYSQNKPNPEQVVENTFVAWVRQHQNELSKEFQEMFNEEEWQTHTPSWQKCPQLVLGQSGEDTPATDFLTLDQIDELEKIVKKNLYSFWPVEFLKKKWRAAQDLWDRFEVIGYGEYEWNEDRWGENL